MFRSMSWGEALTAALMTLALSCAVILAGMAALPARELYPGQYAQYDDATKQWFRGVRSPSGVPCCDIADGHRTEFKTIGAEYWVPIEETWMQVPPESIVKGSKNPTGQAVVWWIKGTNYPNGIFIRCFVLPEMG